MVRLTPLSGRERDSPPDDISNTQRSSTEAHEDGKSCDMSVADHRTPVPVSGRETSVWRGDSATDVSIQKYNTQNYTEESDTCICTSPRKLNSKAYAATPHSKPTSTVSDVEPAGLIVTASEREIALNTPSVSYIPGKMHRYFTPVPYSRSNTSFSPVKWQGQMDVGALESNDAIATKQQISCLGGLETKRLSQMSNSNELNVGNTPVPSVLATTSQTSVDNVKLVMDPNAELIDRERVSENKQENIESVTAIQEHLSSEVDIGMQNDINKKENRRKELLMNMAPCQEPRIPRKQNSTNRNSSQTNTRTTNQTQQNMPSRTGRSKKSTEEKPPLGESEEKQQLKKVFEAHLKGKEHFDRLIEKREQEIGEQLREMDEILEFINTEQSEVEKAAGEYSNTMKIYTNFRDEATRVRVNHLEQELSACILYEENEEIKENVREVYDQIHEIKERRVIGLDRLKKDSEEMKCITAIFKERNDEAEIRIKSKVEEFNRLRVIVMDKGISYVTKRKLVQESDFNIHFPEAHISLSPPLKMAGFDNSALKIEICDVENVSPDITTPRCKGCFESDKLSECIGKDNIDPNGYGSYETETYSTVESYKTTETEENQEQLVDLTGDVLYSTEYANVRKSEKSKELLRHVDCNEAKRQMPLSQEVRIPEVQKRNSRISKPVVRSYSSAPRDICIVSKSSSFAINESDKYKRDEFVPDDQRYVTKPTMEFLDTDYELRRLEKRTGSMIDDRQSGFRTGPMIDDRQNGLKNPSSCCNVIERILL